MVCFSSSGSAGLRYAGDAIQTLFSLPPPHQWLEVYWIAERAEDGQLWTEVMRNHVDPPEILTQARRGPGRARLRVSGPLSTEYSASSAEGVVEREDR